VTDTATVGATRPHHVVAENSWSEYDSAGRYQDDSRQYTAAVLRQLNLAHSGNRPIGLLRTYSTLLTKILIFYIYNL